MGGEVATEWRFRVAVPGEPRRPLVPDLLIVVDPASRTATLSDRAMSRGLRAHDPIRLAALPDFELVLEPFFAHALDVAA